MKIVGQLVCGPNEKYLEETLKEFQRLCDDVIVATCNATDKEIKLLNKYDFRHYEDNREWGKYQPDIKTRLVKTIISLGASHILAADADETFPTLNRQIIEQWCKSNRESAYFYVTNLWNDTDHYSKALSFWNVRFYKADPSKGTQFLRKPLHCGNAPPYFYTLPARDSYVPHILLHKGLMLKEDRLRKAARYAEYDPHAIHKGREYYDALVADGVGSVYNQEEVLNKLKNYYESLKPR